MVLLCCFSPCLNDEGVSSCNKLPDTVSKAELRFCVLFFLSFNATEAGKRPCGQHHCHREIPGSDI